MNQHRYVAESGADTLAFVDESGAGGYSRKLTPERDHELGLVCALLIPAESVDEFRDAFDCGYQRFVAAMPRDAKLHVTDAFESSSKSWAEVARSVRLEFYGLVNRLRIPVVFEARRLRVDRESHALLESIHRPEGAEPDAQARRGEHASQSRVEDSVLKGLFFKLDAFCADYGRQQVDLMFDTLDDSIARDYRKILDSTRKISHSSHTRTRRHPDPAERWSVRLETKVEAPFPLDARFLGELHVVGKNDPLGLATDIVANALYEHLRSVPADAPLNCPTSIEGWELESRVYGVMENAFEDRF